MSVLALVFSSLAVVSLLHAGVFAASSNWYLNGIPMIYRDRARYDQRKANPPWYVRYADALIRLTSGKEES